MQKVGVTGSIGSGKTVVCKVFQQLGVPIYNADERAKYLMITNAQIMETVKQIFGNESYENGALNRKHISAIAFSNKELLEQLNQTVHPIVFTDFNNWILEQEQLNHRYIIKEAALMFETESYKILDKFIVVTAPISLRMSRAMSRDNITEAQVLTRMNNQFSQEEKLAKSDFEIQNDENHSIIKQVVELHKKFMS